MTKQEPLVIERMLNAPVSKVWEAITDRAVMKLMGFDTAAFKAEVGFEFRFEGKKDGVIFAHVCVVTTVVPEKKLAYTWRYDGHEGISHVTFELFAEGEETKLRLTHTGLEAFSMNGPNFARENFKMGWTAIIGTIIKDYVENR